MSKTTKKPTRIPEFHFEQDTDNSGTLTYRCMELVIIADPSQDKFEDGDLAFIEEIVDTLNGFYPHSK